MESDSEFLDGMEWRHGHHMTREHRDRLFALARKGASEPEKKTTSTWWTQQYGNAMARDGAAADAGWRPIETAPKDGTVFIAPSIDGKNVTVGSWSKFYDCWDDRLVGHLNGHWKPTHWMPLPPPPEQEGV